MINRHIKQKAFTLVELLVAVSLFTVVTFIALGAIVTVFDANKRAQSTRTVVDNLNLSVEDMIRTIRFGSVYNCGDPLITGITPDTPNNCSMGDSQMSISFQGAYISYRLNGTTVERSDDTVTYHPITSSDVVIENLIFRVFGADTSDGVQPYVIVLIKGYTGTRPTLQSSFVIETTVSQRELDVN